MKRIIGYALIFSLMVFPVQPLWADQTNFSIGEAALPEWRIALGARPTGMGEAFVGLADDLNATTWNAAGLAQLSDRQIGLMHTIYLQDMSLEYLAYAQPLTRGSGLGIQIVYMNYGEMERVNLGPGDAPEDAGVFNPWLASTTVGYGQFVLPWLALGGGLKFAAQSIDQEQITAWAVDLGVWTQWSDNFKMGGVVQNLGPQMSGADLPVVAKLGMAYHVPVQAYTNSQLTFLADCNAPVADWDFFSLHVGTEYMYQQIAAVRIGYQLQDRGGLSGLVGLTAGAGIRLGKIQCDYGLTSYGDLGLAHQIMAAIIF